ncbi:hypothetical protein K443DRAFT_9045 [Laccaria amethystina LaAM-08-1]|uniref:F-box domain-containing protein n=1 Tax=Laccaria amethystina LaAM-08-1 TaxID=1095629 RepID=A0A0C9X0F9_9AGAR|nr:hypothetical protein K443DRAFT_9045 [Laccaria amethystina LaAM-08-1]
MQSPTHLPDELLENIVDRLEDEPLMQLSMTCRRFHFLALPIVLARANIKDRNTRYLYLHDPLAHILPALRLALFVQNVDSLSINFGNRTNTILTYTLRPTINPAKPVGRLLGHFCEAMKSVIPQKLARLSSSRNHCHGLHEFQALSPVLFHPPFIDWTMSTLQTNSQTLTAVSFEINETAVSTYLHILSSITLPFLSKFKLTPGGVFIEWRIVKFNDVLGFLTRHPSIVDLDLHAITHPRNRRQPQRLLPALQNLRADPWLISWFLNRKRPFKFLTSLEIVSEVTTLQLSFYPEAGIAEWLDNHISQENSPLTALEGVTTLNLFMRQVDVRDLIPQFLARFSQLQHLTYTSPPPEVERELNKMSFIWEVMLACPGMKTVTIEGSQVNLDMLRN